MVNQCDSFRWVNQTALFPRQMLKVLEQLSSTHARSRRVHYTYDLLEQRTLYATASVAALLGYCPTTIAEMGAIELARLIHPDDLEAVAAHYQTFYTLRYGDVISLTYRMRRADGTWCWLRSQETVLAEAVTGPVPTQILGTIQATTPLPILSVRRRRITLPRRRIQRIAALQCSYLV